MRKLILFLFPVWVSAITINDNLEVVADTGENWGKYNDSIINHKEFASEIKAAIDAKALDVNVSNPERAKAIVNAVPASYVSEASRAKIDADLVIVVKTYNDNKDKFAMKEAVAHIKGSTSLDYLFENYSDRWAVVTLAISEYLWSIVDKEPLRAQEIATNAYNKGIALSAELLAEIAKMVSELPPVEPPPE